MDRRRFREASAMAGPERIEWRRSPPSRALGALAWYAAAAAFAVGAVFLLFGAEPEHLGAGVTNPVARVPTWALLLAGLGAVPFVLAVLRRPLVAANHYALTVRPGSLRTLVLPWARVAEVTVAGVAGEEYLLVRCGTGLDPLGDRPQWVDQAVLRRVARDDMRLGQRFHLAVRLRDFVGGTDGRIAALAAFAPDHVNVANQLDPA
jgi:hypothetical protein